MEREIRCRLGSWRCVIRTSLPRQPEKEPGKSGQMPVAPNGGAPRSLSAWRCRCACSGWSGWWARPSKAALP